jgi:hypothetical protein
LIDCGYEDLSRCSLPRWRLPQPAPDRDLPESQQGAGKAADKAFELKYDYHNVNVVLNPGRRHGGRAQLSASVRVKAEAL